MNQDSQHDWSTATVEQDDDFSNFLDFNNVDLDFSRGEDMVGSGNEQQDAMEISNETFARQMSSARAHSPITIAFASANSLSEMSLRHPVFSQPQQTQTQCSQVHSDHHLRQQRPISGYYRHDMVPLTPKSVEMRGQVPPYSDPQALGMYESGKHQDQIVFTPLVSPAFQLPEFTQNSEYFSPLTSPALQAQDHMSSAMVSGEQGPDRRKDLSTPTVKNTKRRANTTSKDLPRAIRSSPAMKAQQKRYSASSKGAKDVSEVISDLQSLQQVSPGRTPDCRASALRGEADSETGSISPEPLSEVLMPPPAAPRSSDHGQNSLSDQYESLSKVSESNLPATPASLFRIQRPSLLSALRSDTSKPQPVHLSTHANEPIPVLAAHVTSNSSDTDSSAVSRNAHARSAPVLSMSMTTSQASEVCSPTRSQPILGSTEPSVSGRAKKKRGSSSHVSPALRPRISPSIKPLLPGIAKYDSETTTALLANKSNYERIIDGSASQLGVNYSARLSENLTSKRTSHKIAEQGRRNRINTALSEIQTLLPEDSGRDNTDSFAGNAGGASKAKTVENAIEFIKSLKRELADTKSELVRVRARVEELEDKASQLQENYG